MPAPAPTKPLLRIGDRVRLARLTLRWTQKQLAATVRLSHNKVWRLENGQYAPTSEERHRIARALHVAGAELFAELEPPPQAAGSHPAGRS